MTEFTEYELRELAEMLCGRVDALKEIAENNKSMPDSTKRSIEHDLRTLETLDSKLRPYYNK